MTDYKNKIRVRGCGVLIENDRLLLVQLKSPITDQLIWIPPGGGMEFGEDIKSTVKRELREETGLSVRVKELLHFNEIIESRFHVIEFYFRVERISGKLMKGFDPELSDKEQIIKDIRFIPINELSSFPVVPEYFKNQFWDERGTVK